MVKFAVERLFVWFWLRHWSSLASRVCLIESSELIHLNFLKLFGENFAPDKSSLDFGTKPLWHLAGVTSLTIAASLVNRSRRRCNTGRCCNVRYCKTHLQRKVCNTYYALHTMQDFHWKYLQGQWLQFNLSVSKTFFLFNLLRLWPKQFFFSAQSFTLVCFRREFLGESPADAWSPYYGAINFY